MQIIIIGCGKVGSSLAAALIEQDQDVVIVDSDPALILAADTLDCIKITGVPIDRDVLRQAGIETADVVCAVTQNDNINIMASQIAREIFGVKRIYTRVFNPSSRGVFNDLGLESICSTQLTVQAFIRAIQEESDEERHLLYGARLLYTRAPVNSSLVGTDITNLASDAGKTIIGLTRRGRLMLAVPGLRIQAGDEIVQAELE